MVWVSTASLTHLNILHWKVGNIMPKSFEKDKFGVRNQRLVNNRGHLENRADRISQKIDGAIDQKGYRITNVFSWFCTK